MKNVTIAIMSVVILAFCAYGFGSKFYEFCVIVMQHDAVSSEGRFAVMPMANYLLASAGFMLLLGWAAANGMFTDIERPKQDMLDHEALLDAGRDDVHYADSVL